MNTHHAKYSGHGNGHGNGHPKPRVSTRRPPPRHLTGLTDVAEPAPVPKHPTAPLILGGAGFIGTNLAERLARDGQDVTIFDNLSRRGVHDNADYLLQTYPRQITLIEADIRDYKAVARAVASASRVYHFAAQVAVTTSLVEPLEDFEINLRGTLNVLEALRDLHAQSQTRPAGRQVPPLLFTSTNKVYGDLHGLELVERERHYQPTDPTVRSHGFAEGWLDFHSPYGCSKGGADQYVLDYARTYGLPATVFRMSCIYGPHQCGNEDQGWVAHFVKAALADQPVTLYGDGKQVRDVLYVDDLIAAMTAALDQIDSTAGQAYNIGGGPANAVSLLQMLDLIADVHGCPLDVGFDDWRTGDQRYYVSDTRKLEAAIGWTPTTPAEEGLTRLHAWLRSTTPQPVPG